MSKENLAVRRVTMRFLTSIFLAAFAFSICSVAQTNPLPLGSVSNVSPVTCTSQFKSSVCYRATVSCPNTADIGVMWGLRGTGGEER